VRAASAALIQGLPAAVGFDILIVRSMLTKSYLPAYGCVIALQTNAPITVPEVSMSTPTHPVALVATDVPPRAALSIYPEPYASLMRGREKRQLGEAFGLKNFGANLTRLAPGGMSALRHAHAKQDEFIYILEGAATLVTDEGHTPLRPGMCAGFRAGTGNAHHLKNEGEQDVVYLEIGDRTPGDSAVWPDDDLQMIEIDGKRRFAHRDGTPY
jgi:uncharacterized cupin superfamily protein